MLYSLEYVNLSSVSILKKKINKLNNPKLKIVTNWVLFKESSDSKENKSA